VIRRIGAGAFSHWGRELFFSASDNSDPSTNGRTYHVLAPTRRDQLSSLQCHDDNERDSALPVNYDPATRQLDKLESDAEYALSCARGYLETIPGGKNGLLGKKVLEIGPGPSFATALILKVWGATIVAVADRYLARFDKEYHRALYCRIANILLTEDRTSNVKPLEVCAREGHSEEQILSCELPLEYMSRKFDSFFDITLSNAVFEHLYNPSQALAGLYAITAPRGIGLHQVDFRDHSDFDKPLEYLLLDEMTFAQVFQNSHGECGNRLRPFQMEHMFQQAGFGTIKFQSNLEPMPDYLSQFLPRLRAARSSLFYNIDQKCLASIGGRFIVKK
jgi:SAM-dependent methyltransferase